MEKLLRTNRARDRVFALILAAVVTALIFSPFLGQRLFSDVVTFNKKDVDTAFLDYPSFIYASDFPARGTIDMGTFNGATEPAFRAVISTSYPLFTLFSLIGKATSYYLVYILFFAVHMWAFLFFGMLIGMEHFGMKRRFAALFSISSLPVVLSTTWYCSFYLATTLFMPTLYLAIRSFRSKRVSELILCSVGYVFTFLCGSAVTAVFSSLAAFGIALIYEFLWQDEWERRSVVKRVWMGVRAPLISGAVVFLHFLQVLQRTRMTVYQGKYSMQLATEWSLSPTDINFAFTWSVPLKDNLVEGFDLFYIGLSWVILLLVLLVFGKLSSKLSKRRKAFIGTLFGIAAVFFALAMGRNAPVIYWFYSLVPVLGSSHLPIRFLETIMPLFFLACSLTLENQENTNIVPRLFSVGAVLCMGAIVYILCGQAPENGTYYKYLIVELIFAAGFMFSAQKGICTNCCIFFLICSTVIPTLNRSRMYTELVNNRDYYQNYSLAYSEDAQKTLDDFISRLPNKERYRFVAFEDDQVPLYIPSNYAWFDLSAYKLTNYSGYDLHISPPADYLAHFGWFNSIDWQYVMDTRGDFAILNRADVEANLDFYNNILDFDFGYADLNATNRVYRLKHFVPSYYTQEEYVLDDDDVMDNGYFYCPDLTMEDLVSFESNDATYYGATIRADRSTDIEVLFFPNDCCRYYLNGMEISPIIENDRVFVPVGAGENVIEVRYVNYLNTVSNVIMVTYMGAIAAGIVCMVVRSKRHGK